MKRLSLSLAAAMLLACGGAQAADEPLVLARDGFMYIGGKTTQADGHEYLYGQMYVEIRVPAKQTHPFPIIMVHGGSMSGTNYTGTPDGREGWAQYFVRQGYAVYVVDQPGHWVCSAACGHNLNFSCETKRDAELSRGDACIGPVAAVRNPERPRPG